MIRSLPGVAIALALAAAFSSSHQHAHHQHALPERTETAGGFDALVLECHDGDSCTLLVWDQRVHVGVHGIDAPELNHPFDPEARAIVLRLVLNHHVTVHPAGRSYDHLVADLVFVDGPDTGADVATALVDAGGAWVEQRYSTDPTAPARQAAAQRHQTGLWADPNARPPWVWRHTRH